MDTSIKFSDIWNILSTIDCSAHTEKKIGGKDKFGNTVKLTYLSWTWAWGITMKHFPCATYTIREWDGKPYLNDPLLGIIVMTEVEIGGNKRSMWLPVMDSRNNAMKQEAYIIKGAFDKETRVAQASMMDVNKAIMRCLVKNLAMFGLGINIYAGEDLPMSVGDELPDDKKTVEPPKKTVKDKSNPAKPKCAPAPTQSPLPEAKQAWADFNSLEYVKAMTKDARCEEWKKILMDNSKCESAAEVTAEGWIAVNDAIDVLRAV